MIEQQITVILAQHDMYVCSIILNEKHAPQFWEMCQDLKVWWSIRERDANLSDHQGLDAKYIHVHTHQSSVYNINSICCFAVTIFFLDTKNITRGLTHNISQYHLCYLSFLLYIILAPQNSVKKMVLIFEETYSVRPKADYFSACYLYLTLRIIL